jgi:hypothetical protein
MKSSGFEKSQVASKNTLVKVRYRIVSLGRPINKHRQYAPSGPDVKTAAEVVMSPKLSVPRPNQYFCAALLLLLAACSASTPYQRFGEGIVAGGYSEVSHDQGMYTLTFSGNGHSTMEQVVTYWNRRANELCPNGFNVLSKKGGIGQGSFDSSALLPVGNILVPVSSTTEVNIPHLHGEIKCADPN